MLESAQHVLLLQLQRGHKRFGACAFSVPLQMHSSRCLSLFTGLEFLWGSDVKTCHREVLFPIRLVTASMVRKGKQGVKFLLQTVLWKGLLPHFSCCNCLFQ